MVEQAKELVADPRAALQDLSRHEWASWRHHPVTKAVQQYLRDRRETLWAELRERFKAGSLTLQDEREFRGRLLESEDFEQLEWDWVLSFYSLKEDEHGATIPDTEGEQPSTLAGGANDGW